MGDMLMRYNKLTFVFQISIVVCWGLIWFSSEKVIANNSPQSKTLSTSCDSTNVSCESTVNILSEPNFFSQESSVLEYWPEQEYIVSLSNDDFITELQLLCEQLKNKLFEKPINDSLFRQKLLNELTSLKRLLRQGGNAQKANDWENYLQLNEVQKELSKSQPNPDILALSFEHFRISYYEEKGNFVQPAYLALQQYISCLKWINKTENEEKTFQQTCDFLPIYIQKLVEQYDADASEATTIALDLLVQYGIHFQETQNILKMLQSRFSSPNFQIVITKKLLNLLPQTQQVISEPVNVVEDIRGTYVQGQGKMNGLTTFRFIPNSRKAEIQLVVDSTIQTQTTGYNKGARITSANASQVRALKSIFWDRQILTTPAIVDSEFQSSITGIDPGRIIGARIVQHKVAAEKPLSEAESKRRTENRFAQRVDRETDSRIALLNDSFQDQWRQLFQQISILPQNISSQTTQNELYWNANIGKENQLGLNYSQNIIAEPEINFPISIQMHESCPNNILFSAFSGKRLNDQQLKERINNIFSQAKVGNAQFKSEAELNQESLLWFQFSNELPITLTFSENEIIIVMKFDGFEKEGLNYPKLNVEIIYQIISDQANLTLQKKSVDAFPGDIEKGTTIPARYQAIRTIVINKLNDSLQEIIPLQSIDFSTKPNLEDNQENSNATSYLSLLPKRMSTQEGWLNIEFDLQNNPQ